MMKYPNFVSEEWSHVLTWDLLVGRLIWLDGLQNNIFTSHSVLLTNLIGPPGLLLHFLTCFFYRKNSFNITSTISSNGLLDIESNKVKESKPIPIVKTPTAGEIVSKLFSNLLNPSFAKDIIEICDENVEWEYTNQKDIVKGKSNVESMIVKRSKGFPTTAQYVIDKITDGTKSIGFSWYLRQDGVDGKGLRGITYVEFNDKGKIVYVREVAEPLFKPGLVTSKLLKAITDEAVKKDPNLLIKRPTPAKRATGSASDLVTFLWKEVNGSDKDLVLSLFSDDIVYEDLNFAKPFIGKEEVKEFISEFDFPGIKFIPERISDGRLACCFTWRVELAGVQGYTRGISYYETNTEGTLVKYIRDIPEPAIKPAPLQEIASLINPGLRRFKPLPIDAEVLK